MDVIYVADATALLQIPFHITEERKTVVFDSLTQLVEKRQLRFPRAVVDDLAIRARNEQITAWCQGQGNKLRRFAPDIEHTMWLMQKLQIELGYDAGVEDVDGKEPSIVGVASYVRQLVSQSETVKVVTEDRSSNPLRPSMWELCDRFDWTRCSATDFLSETELE